MFVYQQKKSEMMKLQKKKWRKTFTIHVSKKEKKNTSKFFSYRELILVGNKSNDRAYCIACMTQIKIVSWFHRVITVSSILIHTRSYCMRHVVFGSVKQIWNWRMLLIVISFFFGCGEKRDEEIDEVNGMAFKQK